MAFTSKYQTDIDNLINELKGMNFSYDPNTDANYQAYAKDIDTQSKLAQENTLGKLAKRTFGLPSSYAISEVTNVGNQYAKQKSDGIDTYRQAALALYNNNLNQKQNMLNTLLSLREQEENTYNNQLAAYAAALKNQINNPSVVMQAADGKYYPTSAMGFNTNYYSTSQNSTPKPTFSQNPTAQNYEYDKALDAIRRQRASGRNTTQSMNNLKLMVDGLYNSNRISSAMKNNLYAVINGDTKYHDDLRR